MNGEKKQTEAGGLFPAEKLMPVNGPGSTIHTQKKVRKKLPGFISQVTAGCRPGWFLDEKDGSWYYLRKTSDGNQGKMQTGWLKEGEKWYYLGPTGRMTKGWNWIDGKCYYMDQKNGHMLAGCMTPDGYTVDDTGAWCVHGVVQTFGKK